MPDSDAEDYQIETRSFNYKRLVLTFKYCLFFRTFLLLLTLIVIPLALYLHDHEIDSKRITLNFWEKVM